MSKLATGLYLTLIALSALFETFFAYKALTTPDALVDPDNLRALWWLQAYSVAILSLSLISVMGFAMRANRQATFWITIILTFFHSIQFSGVLAKDWPEIIVSPGYAHGLVALLGYLFLITRQIGRQNQPS